MIEEYVIEDIKSRADIADIIEEYVPLKKTGRNYTGLCPFHHEKTPSFSVSADNQFFHCFGCHEHGNVISFIMKIENMDFLDAVKLLADKVGVIIKETKPTGNYSQGKPEGQQQTGQNKKNKLYLIMEELSKWYIQNLKSQEGKKALDYIQNRQISSDCISKFKIGYSFDSWDKTIKWGLSKGFTKQQLLDCGLIIIPDEKTIDQAYDRFRGRLMFSISNDQGKVIAFSARTLNPEEKHAKYINSPETLLFHKGKVLYGFHLAKQAIRETQIAYLCEGQIDVIACHSSGITNAVAPQGTAFTHQQSKLLARFAKKVIVSFDSDNAGQKAALKAYEELLSVGLSTAIIKLPFGEDPDSIKRNFSKEKLYEYFSHPTDFFNSMLEEFLKKEKSLNFNERTEAIEAILQKVALLPDSVTRAFHIQHISSTINIPDKDLLREMNNFINLNARRNRNVPKVQNFSNENKTLLSSLEKAQLTLFDLALRHGFIAHELAEKLPHEYLGTGIYAKLLNQILALTEQGEWKHAGQIITEMYENKALPPEICKIFIESEFEEFAEENKENKEKILRAQSDCLNLLQHTHFKKKQSLLQQKIQQENDPLIKRELRKEYFEIAKTINSFNSINS